MTDKEQFQRVFDKLHASPDVLTEVLNMTTDEKVVSIRKKCFTPKAVAAAAALVLAVGSGSAAYAMDLGGIQRTVQVWIHGDQTDAAFTVENGSYTLDYTDADGNEVQQGGGGVAYENGKERPLTADEMLEGINMPEVEYKEDNTVWVYYLDQKMEITDNFKDGFCYVQLKENGHTLYLTVKYQDGYAASSHGYIQPEEFN